ncbi:MAG TPA: sortase [Roseiflexaceae bacterium]|nr:sortase [Roseiflexaceae bacterium]
MRFRVLMISLFVLPLYACGSNNQADHQTNALNSAAQAAAQATPIAPTTTPATAQQPTTAPTAARQPTAAPTEAPLPTSVPPTEAPTPDPVIDQPLLTRPTSAVPTPAAPPEHTQPARIAIEAIGMDRGLVSVGLDPANVPVVPDHDVGWYNLSAGPGEGENIVLWGHVLRFRHAPEKPAPFARMKELLPGARIVLYDQGGKAHRYVVTQQVQVTPDQVEYILPVGKERVTLVSCIGDKVIAEGGVVEMSHRLVTIAEPEV